MYFSLVSREEKDDSQKSDSVSGPPNTSANQEVDDDGYVIRPTVTQTWNEKTNFYSSSDSGSGKLKEKAFDHAEK